MAKKKREYLPATPMSQLDQSSGHSRRIRMKGEANPGSVNSADGDAQFQLSR
jgi:hypothetical protein